MSASAPELDDRGGSRPLVLAWLLLGLVAVRPRRKAAQETARAAARPSAAGAGADTPEAAGRMAAAEPERGRMAATPAAIPAPGWKDVLWRTWKEVAADDVAGVARSIAFSGMLALFPALAAFVSIYGLFADVSEARQHLSALAGVVPGSAMTFLGEQMVRIAAQKDASLSFTFLLSLVLAVWSANSGMKALFKGLNIAYEEEERRGFVRLNLVTLGFTVGTILFLTLALGVLVAIPAAIDALGLGAGARVTALLRWPALLAVAVFGFSVLYRFGPSRDRPQWRWVSWGAVAAAVLWMVGSALFSWYLTNFGHYNETYGSLGAVFGFMMWLWLSAVVVLLGAELNSEMEHQTARDTTAGPEAPLGARGARMADTVGPSKTGSLLPKLGRSSQRR